ncbi:hypothetical protein BJV77DRAFT_216914 [Russula vinacea]|nr:hypothetical protein BJV77DRAFT_216914 [Russula vinacea]
MTKVNDGTIRIRAAEWPAFLYDQKTEYDPENEEKGLLKGYVLVRAFRHIFTSPSSAIHGRRDATKRSKAQLHGLTAVTGRTIAYAAVQARIALCSLEKWNRHDGDFNHEKLYNNIVTLFEHDPDDPWVIKTLDWWNSVVPGLVPDSKKRKRHNGEPDSNDADAAERIFALREARRRRQEETRTREQAPPSPNEESPRGAIAAPQRSSESEREPGQLGCSPTQSHAATPPTACQ